MPKGWDDLKAGCLALASEGEGHAWFEVIVVEDRGDEVFVVLTPSIAALPEDQKRRLLDRVRAFDAIDAGNDPWAEHDFGSIELEGDTFFWKIDACDLALEAYSPDATDPDVTRRVLTVMRADEY